MNIGIAKGPGETPNEYTFVTPDTERRVKTSEFVYYEADVDGVRRQILGRVVRRVPLRLYPDSFLAHPEVDPAQMAALVGYSNANGVSLGWRPRCRHRLCGTLRNPREHHGLPRSAVECLCQPTHPTPHRLESLLGPGRCAGAGTESGRFQLGRRRGAAGWRFRRVAAFAPCLQSLETPI